MGTDITRLHHVGLVVDDMAEALDRYRRLGFALPPPSYPTMARREGEPPEPFGAANTHADFARNFVELATYVKDGAAGQVPAEARLVPLHAPAELLPVLVERIAGTTANLAACLERFEGLHILMFESGDIDATAARLTAGGVAHGGVNTVQRPVETATGTRLEPVRYLEIDSGEPGARPGVVPEGRVGVAAGTGSQQHQEHPNGAVELVDVMLSVADDGLAAAVDRYARYLGRPARPAGPAQVFDLGGTTVTVVADSALPTLLPGERAAALPALVAYTVAVRDVAQTRQLLTDNGFPLRQAASGDPFVPAAAALGAAVAFRPAAG